MSPSDSGAATFWSVYIVQSEPPSTKTNNWRPAQDESSFMDVSSSDWRCQLQPEARQKIVNKIMAGQKLGQKLAERRDHPGVARGVPVGYIIAQRQEQSPLEKNKAVRSKQSDYLRKISLKMLSMETKTQQKTPMNPLPGVNQNSTDAGVVGEAGNSRGGRSQKRPQPRRLKKWPRNVTHYGRNKFCNWTTCFCCIVMASNVISAMAVPSILLWLCFPPSSFTGDISIGILSEFVVCCMSFI